METAREKKMKLKTGDSINYARATYCIEMSVKFEGVDKLSVLFARLTE